MDWQVVKREKYPQHGTQLTNSEWQQTVHGRTVGDRASYLRRASPG